MPERVEWMKVMDVIEKSYEVDADVKRTNFSFKTPDGIDINAYRWESESGKNVRGIIQIAHGMAEHILRYDDVSRYLVANGFIVYGHDHRGHGGTIKAPDDKGFFANEDGFHKVVQDMKQLSDLIRKEHLGLPLFLLGHSLGSFITRRYIQLYDGVSGVILSGTGYDKGIGKIGLQIAKLERRRKGPRTPSPLMDKLVFYGFNENFEPAKTEFDFLTRDENVVEKYVKDDKCGFVCATSFYIDLLTGLDLIHRKTEVAKTPRDLPILLISGTMDPVGEEGKGVRKVYKLYKRARCKKIRMKLYKDGRHEMLNEINKDEVYEDILTWLDKVLKGGRL
mgnify:CR=1 FL=1